MIGLPGKWPAQSSSVTVLRATTRSPGTSSITSSIRSNGSRCGRIASIAALSMTTSVMPTAALEGRCARGGRSTWRCRRAARWPPRSRRTDVERVLQHDDSRLGRRQLREAAAELEAGLRLRQRAGRIAVRGDTGVLEERLRPARRRPAGLRDVLARVDDEPVQPGRELRLAPELADPLDELRQGLLRGIARVLGVAQDVQRDPLDPGGVPLAERRQRQPVSVLRASTRIGSESLS